ncbi:hypothetical protein HanIR_Chr16g0816191 [Helianthus annuus]|nr:hypothetical protein HanIR_Chr16g0816191 [Helianthus annuus]
MRSNIVFKAKHQTPCLLQLVTKQADFDFIHFSLDMTHMQKGCKSSLCFDIFRVLPVFTRRF